MSKVLQFILGPCGILINKVWANKLKKKVYKMEPKQCISDKRNPSAEFPRTSTPLPDILRPDIMEAADGCYDQYDAWADKLHKPPRYVTYRSAIAPPNGSVISGHTIPVPTKPPINYVGYSCHRRVHQNKHNSNIRMNDKQAEVKTEVRDFLQKLAIYHYGIAPNGAECFPWLRERIPQPQFATRTDVAIKAQNTERCCISGMRDCPLCVRSTLRSLPKSQVADFISAVSSRQSCVSGINCQVCFKAAIKSCHQAIARGACYNFSNCLCGLQYLDTLAKNNNQFNPFSYQYEYQIPSAQHHLNFY